MNKIDNVRKEVLSLIEEIENEFNKKLEINTSYAKENDLKFHCFDMDKYKFIHLGKLIYKYNDINDWVNDKEINKEIIKEIISFEGYFCDYEGECMADNDDYMSLGYDIARHIINNPKFKECREYNGNIVYVLQSELEIYNIFENSIKEFMIIFEKFSEDYFTKNLKDGEKEAMAYNYLQILLSYYF